MTLLAVTMLPFAERAKLEPEFIQWRSRVVVGRNENPRFDTRFEGVHWRDLETLVRPKPTARFVIAHAEQGFTANSPLAAIEDDNALIVYEADGEPLTPDHGWPARLFVPTKYFWKSAKWLTGLELTASDKPGFWERYGYNNNADYWKEERYGF